MNWDDRKSEILTKFSYHSGVFYIRGFSFYPQGDFGVADTDKDERTFENELLSKFDYAVEKDLTCLGTITEGANPKLFGDRFFPAGYRPLSKWGKRLQQKAIDCGFLWFKPLWNPVHSYYATLFSRLGSNLEKIKITVPALNEQHKYQYCCVWTECSFPTTDEEAKFPWKTMSLGDGAISLGIMTEKVLPYKDVLLEAGFKRFCVNDLDLGFWAKLNAQKRGFGWKNEGQTDDGPKDED